MVELEAYPRHKDRHLRVWLVNCRHFVVAVLAIGLMDARLVSLSQPPATAGGKFVATARDIHDGDTFVAVDDRGTKINVRIYGVDAPERAQEFGNASTRFLSELIGGKRIEVYPANFERNNRLVARVTIAGLDASLALIRAGLAWHSPDFSRDPILADAERVARHTRTGLWRAQSPISPWVFRRSTRQPAVAMAAAAQSGPFHGNVRSFVFHAPGCVDYRCKSCSRAFATAAAAQTAGFRPHTRCVRR